MSPISNRSILSILYPYPILYKYLQETAKKMKIVIRVYNF